MKRVNQFCLLLSVVVIMIICSCNESTGTSEKTIGADTAKPVTEAVKPEQPSSTPIDKNKISGDWVRTDAPYHITIETLTDDGSMKAAYLNPKSINVSKARWFIEAGAVKIYMELRDANYPGSNYNLLYLPGKDILTGKYFQAVEGISYDVEFTRVK